MRGIFFSIVLCLLILPLAVSAQSQIDINWQEPVPVPRPAEFGGACGLTGQILNLCGPAGQSTVTGLILTIISMLLAVTGLLAVLFLIIGGLRYITAHGNEEQAEGAKKTLQHAVIGLIIVILSFVIIRIIANALIYNQS